MLKKIFLSVFLVSLILLFFTLFWGGSFLKQNYFQGNLGKDLKKPVNFLLLGMNGQGGPGDDLTDTIIFVSLDPVQRKISLLSLPRDIWVTEIQAKINAAFHYGGFALVKGVAEGVLGQKIDRVFVLNFSNFEKLIDALGGLTVEVQQSFDDYKYPIAGKENDLCNGDRELKCRYEHLHFDQGLQFMDGKTALKFVRSRNAQGEEGTDFARSLRQQQILKALKGKLFSKEIYQNFRNYPTYFELFQNSFVTDLSRQDYGNLLLLASRLDWNNLKTASLSEDNFLIHPKSHYSGQWVLVSKDKDWQEFKNFVKEFLK
ncbi:MAG: LCP family protein [Patescibacteria group bacterium]|nr:LCP family protein [Patescibacteria group bacterium]